MYPGGRGERAYESRCCWEDVWDSPVFAVVVVAVVVGAAAAAAAGGRGRAPRSGRSTRGTRKICWSSVHVIVSVEGSRQPAVIGKADIEAWEMY